MRRVEPICAAQGRDERSIGGDPGRDSATGSKLSSSLCDEREAARRLGLSVATLRRRRSRRQAPSWLKVGSRILYRPRDIEDFIEASVVPLVGTLEERR